MACHPREGGREFKNSVADQDDENRIAPAGFNVNGEETWNWTRHAALVRTAAIAPSSPTPRAGLPDLRDRPCL